MNADSWLHRVLRINHGWVLSPKPSICYIPTKVQGKLWGEGEQGGAGRQVERKSVNVIFWKYTAIAVINATPRGVVGL